VGRLESELDKVSAFCTIKSNELNRRVQHCESSLEFIIKQENSDFSKVEQEIGFITVEVSELSKFIRLNYSAFLKVSSY
jgi:SPX domain protein involved in polyphosphate accumulation